MSELMRAAAPVISTKLLHRLMAFYTPKSFNNESTAFDTGYEQCKRDLRDLLLTAVPELAEVDRWGSVRTPEYNIPVDSNPVERDSVWVRIFGKRS